MDVASRLRFVVESDVCEAAGDGDVAKLAMLWMMSRYDDRPWRDPVWAGDDVSALSADYTDVLIDPFPCWASAGLSLMWAVSRTAAY